jgi:hypothetical protein
VAFLRADWPYGESGWLMMFALDQRRVATQRRDDTPLAELAQDLWRLQTLIAVVKGDESVSRQDEWGWRSSIRKERWTGKPRN